MWRDPEFSGQAQWNHKGPYERGAEKDLTQKTEEKAINRGRVSDRRRDPAGCEAGGRGHEPGNPGGLQKQEKAKRQIFSWSLWKEYRSAGPWK